MKKFSYRLEALLKMCRHREQEKQKELAASQTKVINQEQSLKSLSETRQSVMKREAEKKAGSLTVLDLLIFGRYTQRLKKDAVVGTELLKVLKDEEAIKRQALLQAARERKKYDKLKEKESDNYYREIDEAEKKESDEIALNSYRLKQ